ncbi:MAG: hypothetical protein ACKV22_08005 [Bryobacteraceae bacterium]
MSSVVPSPDGRYLAYALTAAETGPERSQAVTQIRLDDVRSGRSIQLTQGEQSSTAPFFSPDLHDVCFLSPRSGHTNIYRIGLDGGEARRLTEWSGEISLFQVSPDGRWIVFAGRPKDAAAELARKQKLDFKVIDEYQNHHSLWIVAASGGEARQLTTSARHVAHIDWSPDSGSVVYEHWESPLFDHSMRADVSEVEIRDGAVKAIGATAAAEAAPYYSPDGRSIAFVRSGDSGAMAGRGAPCGLLSHDLHCPAVGSHPRYEAEPARMERFRHRALLRRNETHPQRAVRRAARGRAQAGVGTHGGNLLLRLSSERDPGAGRQVPRARAREFGSGRGSQPARSA